MKLHPFTFLFSVLAACPVLAQTPSVLWQFDGSPLEGYGSALSYADINLDGHSDIIVGSPLANGKAGRVDVYSGADGSSLLTLHGLFPGHRLGKQVCSVGDTNGDGVPEIAMSAENYGLNNRHYGSVYVVSGMDGSLLWDVWDNLNGTSFGSSLDACDVNADGALDLIVGSPYTNGFTGLVKIYSGVDGSELMEFHGAGLFSGLGSSVSSAGDVDLDGHDDFIIGSIFAEGGGTDLGEVTVYSGRTASPLHHFVGQNDGDSLGSCVDGAGDANGDGIPDFVIGATGTDVGGMNSGSVYVKSGADGSSLWRVDGSSTFAGIGNNAYFAGDVNGDGFDDVIISDNNGFSPFSSAPGSAWIYSGLDGSLLWQFDGDLDRDQFGKFVVAVGDVNGNGTDDFAISATGTSDTQDGYLRVYDGTESALDLNLFSTTVPTGGSMALHWSVGTPPGNMVTLFAGTGQGRGYLPNVGKLEILQPWAVTSHVSNSVGNARLSAWIPMSWVGMPLWLQAVDDLGQRSNVAFYVIQ